MKTGTTHLPDLTDTPSAPGAPTANGALREEWRVPLAATLASEQMLALRSFLQAERAAGKVIYPPMPEVFAALNALTPADVRVVILGQDPYPGANQAHGLSFSVRPGVPVPRSLANIYAELRTEFGIAPAQHGYLMPWARQGVLLLNSVLTVEANASNSHKGRGWEAFSDAVIDLVNARCEHVVFLLWGKQAQNKGARVDTTRHLVLKAAHPSPLSAYDGFFGCAHFTQTNAYLRANGRTPIDWQLGDCPPRANTA
jgi:uracil-DNA glycosylase